MQDADFLEFFFYNSIPEKKHYGFYSKMAEKLYKEKYENLSRLELEVMKKLVHLSLWKRIQLKINGYVFLMFAKKPGWKGFLPFYVVRCKKHKILFLDYPHGYRNYFMCPLCLEEGR